MTPPLVHKSCTVDQHFPSEGYIFQGSHLKIMPVGDHGMRPGVNQRNWEGGVVIGRKEVRRRLRNTGLQSFVLLPILLMGQLHLPFTVSVFLTLRLVHLETASSQCLSRPLARDFISTGMISPLFGASGLSGHCPSLRYPSWPVGNAVSLI